MTISLFLSPLFSLITCVHTAHVPVASIEAQEAAASSFLLRNDVCPQPQNISYMQGKLYLMAEKRRGTLSVTAKSLFLPTKWS